MSIDQSIKDKVIFITGAAGLIGSVASRHFLSLGAKVVMTDINASLLESKKVEMPAQENILCLPLDITDEAACHDAVAKTVSQFGKLDVLINNAAIDAKFDDNADASKNQTRFENFPIAALRKAVDVNLNGTIIMTQAACKAMLHQGFGNIINLASTYSVVAPNQHLYDFGDNNKQFKPVDYVASKSFIPNFTRYIATFYASENIRCNALVPHGIYNNHPDHFLKNWARLSPMGRMCHVDELMGPFVFLASDASSYMTGATLNIDGGWTAW